MLKKNTVVRLAKKRGWRIDIREDSDGEVVSTFIAPLYKARPIRFLGAIRLEGRRRHPSQLVWEDARIRPAGNVHINSYHEFPKTMKDCMRMLIQVEELVEKYC